MKDAKKGGKKIHEKEGENKMQNGITLAGQRDDTEKKIKKKNQKKAKRKMESFWTRRKQRRPAR